MCLSHVSTPFPFPIIDPPPFFSPSHPSLCGQVISKCWSGVVFDTNQAKGVFVGCFSLWSVNFGHLCLHKETKNDLGTVVGLIKDDVNNKRARKNKEKERNGLAEKGEREKEVAIVIWLAGSLNFLCLCLF